MDNILKEKERRVYDYIISQMPSSPSVREIGAAVGIKSTSGVHAILKRLEELDLITRKEHSSRSILPKSLNKAASVPLIGRVTAGEPILALQSIEDYLPLPSDLGSGGELFALNVKGRSMINAGILDGDTVIAERNAECRSGDIVIALIEDEATCKRLILNGEEVILAPENPEYSPLRPKEFKILGKVVGNFRRY